MKKYLLILVLFLSVFINCFSQLPVRTKTDRFWINDTLFTVWIHNFVQMDAPPFTGDLLGNLDVYNISGKTSFNIDTSDNALYLTLKSDNNNYSNLIIDTSRFNYTRNYDNDSSKKSLLINENDYSLFSSKKNGLSTQLKIDSIGPFLYFENDENDTSLFTNNHLINKKYFFDQINSRISSNILDTTISVNKTIVSTLDTIFAYTIPATGKYQICVNVYTLLDAVTYSSQNDLSIYLGANGTGVYFQSGIYVPVMTGRGGILGNLTINYIKNIPKDTRVYVRGSIDNNPDSGNVYSTTLFTIKKL